MNKIYGLKSKILVLFISPLIIGFFDKSYLAAVVVVVFLSLFYGSLFYEIIRINDETISFYSTSPFKKNLKFNVKDIRTIKVWFADFSRGTMKVYLSDEEMKKIDVDVPTWKQKNLIKNLVQIGIDVEEARD